jgi:hypothetical protein
MLSFTTKCRFARPRVRLAPHASLPVEAQRALGCLLGSEIKILADLRDVCLTPKSRHSLYTHKIAFSDLNAALANDVVSRRGVEVKVG